MLVKEETGIELPNGGEAVKLHLRSEILALRDAALQLQGVQRRRIPILSLIDKSTWLAREEGEDWLIWRARRTVARLREMPIALSLGERIVGRPELRPSTTEEAKEIARLEEVAIPPHPGGDAGHFHPDYEKLFRVGVRGIREEIRSRRDVAEAQHRFYRACEMAMEGLL